MANIIITLLNTVIISTTSNSVDIPGFSGFFVDVAGFSKQLPFLYPSNVTLYFICMLCDLHLEEKMIHVKSCHVGP